MEPVVLATKSCTTPARQYERGGRLAITLHAARVSASKASMPGVFACRDVCIRYSIHRCSDTF
eukprot:1881149-Amphidinium_carterae.2